MPVRLRVLLQAPPQALHVHGNSFHLSSSPVKLRVPHYSCSPGFLMAVVSANGLSLEWCPKKREVRLEKTSTPALSGPIQSRPLPRAKGALRFFLPASSIPA